MCFHTKKIELTYIIPLSFSGKRIDQVASLLFSDYSRARLQIWIKSGELTVDKKILRPKDRVKGGETVKINTVLKDRGEWEAEDLGPLAVSYEDEDIIVIDKPAGVVVHPGAGNLNHTLLNALLHYAPELKKVPRAGIVHRLDRGTSGLLVVARTLKAHDRLVKAMQKREIEREYETIVSGVMTGGGVIELPIGRHRTKRTQMAVVKEGGKSALTRYWVLNRFKAYTHLKIRLDSGRTHQIRVHLAYIGYPILGDKTYGGYKLQLSKDGDQILCEQLKNFQRPALHARRLGFYHPRNGEKKIFESPMPEDMKKLLEILN